MGGGKGGAKVEVTKFYMSIHDGICAKADRIKRIFVKEKVAWEGSLYSAATIEIDEPELFGGKTKEGGVAGRFFWLPGDADQILPDELAQKLGRSGGTDCPGYRGLATGFWVGDGPSERPGFYWAANNPYLPGRWIECERAPVGLNPSYAMIPRLGTSSEFPVESHATISTFFGFAFAPDYASFIVETDSFAYEIEDVESRSIATTGTLTLQPNLGQNNPVGIDPYGVYWGYPDGFQGDRLLSSAGADFALDEGFMSGVQCLDDMVYCLPFTSNFLQYYNRSAIVCEAISYYPSMFFRETFTSVSVNHWVIGNDGTDITLRCVFGPRLDQEVTFTSPVELDDIPVAGHSGTSFVVGQGEFLFKLDSDTLAVGDVSADLGVQVGRDIVRGWRALKPGSNSIWTGLTEVSLLDLEVIRAIGATVEPVIPGSVVETVYSPNNHALIAMASDAGSTRYWILLDRGTLDANPAHIIYECLTDRDWGRGSPLAAIDEASFEAAGVTLYEEDLGISMLWVRQASIQDFVQEVLNHAQAVLFVDPGTGLLTLKLIRGDYDPETLPEINPSNAELSNFNRKLWGEIPNEVTVTWTNPESGNDETVTVQDLASVVAQGGIVSNGVNLYGVRSAELANRLAQRELRNSGAPLARCEAYVDRSLYLMRPASVVSVVWPEHGLDGVIMRVMDADYGKLGDPTIKLTLLEDVFGLDPGDYVLPPAGTAWEDPSAAPAAMEPAIALTLPYFFAANAAAVTSADYPEVFAGVLASTTNGDTYAYELYTQVVLPDASTEWESAGTKTVIGRATLSAGLDAEATSTGVSFTGLQGDTEPQQAGFAIIGPEDEATTEIALITAEAGTFTLQRGVLDTTPKEWPAGTAVWFVDAETLFEDLNVRASGEEVDYKLLSRTSQGLLSLAAAPIVTAELDDRPWLPSRPAAVEIDGVMFNTSATPVDMTERPDPWVPTAWANRNRLTEDSLVLAWDDATTTPETGQTTKIYVEAADGAVIAEHDSLSGTAFDVPDASYAGHALVAFRFASERTDADGTFESLQGHRIWVQVGQLREEEDGDARMTETGDRRAMED